MEAGYSRSSSPARRERWGQRAAQVPGHFPKMGAGLGDIGGDGNGGSTELVGREAVATWEWFSESTDTISEGNGFLIDDAFFKGEGHGLSSSESRELRVDRSRCFVSAAAALLSPHFSLLSTLSKLLLYFFGFAEKIGATGFEPATSWSQTRRSSQAELRPVMI